MEKLNKKSNKKINLKELRRQPKKSLLMLLPKLEQLSEERRLEKKLLILSNKENLKDQLRRSKNPLKMMLFLLKRLKKHQQRMHQLKMHNLLKILSSQKNKNQMMVPQLKKNQLSEALTEYFL